MGLWNRLRGKAQAAATPVPDHPARPAGDGGWRAVRPMEGVLPRPDLAVSDGMRFRAGLASWQDHTLGTGLGHSISSSAPAGVMHGLARPAGHSGGAPLPVVLRASAPGAPPATPA